MTRLLLSLIAVLTLTLPRFEAQAQPTAIREITQIAGELYRFRNNFHYSVFAVTPAGIIATDPINADAARWLKDELARRFKVPVKYVIYSHDHADHASGGEVFADTAIFVGHELTRAAMLREKRPTVPPTLTFSDRMTLELGGTTVELAYVGRNHSDNSIVMRFPKERVLFAVDFIPVNSMAFRDFPDAYMPDWISSLQRVEKMDFDILAPGHGPLGNKSHVQAHRVFLEDMHAEVSKLAKEGKSLAQVVLAVKLPKYQGWAGYKEMLELNLEGMFRMVRPREQTK